MGNSDKEGFTHWQGGLSDFDRFPDLPRWECQGCREKMICARPANDLCHGCAGVAMVRNMSRAEICRAARIPLIHRGQPAWTNWPRDARRRAKEIHPIDDWIEMVVALTKTTQDGPRSVTLIGDCDSGKSARAAELIVNLHRKGIVGGRWISERELADEQQLGRFESRPVYQAALTAPVIVLDDIFSHDGYPNKVAELRSLLLDIISARCSNTTLVTIVTTHRLFGRKAARRFAEAEAARQSITDERGIKELIQSATQQCIHDMAPAIFGRLIDGLILDLGSQGHRGKWAV